MMGDEPSEASFRTEFGRENPDSNSLALRFQPSKHAEKAELTLKPVSDTLLPVIDPRAVLISHIGRPAYHHEKHLLDLVLLHYDNFDN